MQTIILELLRTALILGLVFVSTYTIVEFIRYSKERKRQNALLETEEGKGSTNGK